MAIFNSYVWHNQRVELIYTTQTLQNPHGPGPKWVQDTLKALNLAM